jgi:hypothetical protein
MTTEAGKGHDADWRNLRAIGEAVVSEYGRGKGRVSPPIEMLGKALTLLAEAGSNSPSVAIEAEAIVARNAEIAEAVRGARDDWMEPMGTEEPTYRRGKEAGIALMAAAALAIVEAAPKP